MRNAAVLDETSAQIGVLLFGTFPYGEVEEQRLGSVDIYTSENELDHTDIIEEGVTVRHTILWRDARNYPSEVAFISSYPGDYYEIGQRVNGTWISAGVIYEFDCEFSSREENSVTTRKPCMYKIKWGRAFNHLPDCKILVISTPVLAS